MTTTKTNTIQEELELANPNTLADASKKAGLARQLAVIKVVCTTLTADANPDITGALVLADSVVTGVVLESGEMLPPVGDVIALHVDASGTAASVGSYIVGTAAATPVLPTGGANSGVGIASLDDDGMTITFPNTITGFTLVYRPRAPVDISAIEFAPSV